MTTEKLVKEKEMFRDGHQNNDKIIANIYGSYKCQEEHTDTFPKTVMFIATSERLLTFTFWERITPGNSFTLDLTMTSG